jgi:hypothetical protein
LWSPGDWNAFFGFGINILVALTYAIVAVFLYALTRYPALAPALTARPSGEVLHATPAE